MFCHGWQNKAASSHGWLVVAGHVTPRKSNSDTLRLFLFSYNGTKINFGFAQNAIHRPATHHLDGRRMSNTNQHLLNNSYHLHYNTCSPLQVNIWFLKCNSKFLIPPFYITKSRLRLFRARSGCLQLTSSSRDAHPAQRAFWFIGHNFLWRFGCQKVVHNTVLRCHGWQHKS